MAIIQRITNVFYVIQDIMSHQAAFAVYVRLLTANHVQITFNKSAINDA